MTAAESSPRAWHVVAFGGLAAALLDIVNAMAFWHLYSATKSVVILQSIAAGLLGKEAFAGGAGGAALGLAPHILIACGMAAVFWLACRRWPVLYRRPVACGIAYGLVTWVAMNHVIVPLARAPPPPFILPWFIDGVLAHVVLVGLLLALVARWSANRR